MNGVRWEARLREIWAMDPVVHRLAGAAALKAGNNTMKVREPAQIPAGIRNADGHKRSAMQKRIYESALCRDTAERSTYSTETTKQR